MYAQYPISHGLRFHKLLHQNQNISSLQISWNIIPEPKYFMVTDCMGYYTRTKIFHGYRFHGILHQIQISHSCRFHEVLHHNQNNLCLHISWDILPEWLQMSWDIPPELLYLIAADFMRYYTRIEISHGCRYHEILD